MLKRSAILFLSCVFSCFTKVHAQYELSIGLTPPVISDTAQMYSKLGVDFWVVNSGEETIYETINAHICVNPSSNNATSRIIYGISFPEGVGLLPGDSMHFYWDAETQEGPYDDVLQQNSYSGGDNIIVVWPMVGVDTNQITEQYFHGLHVYGDESVVKEVESVDFTLFMSNNFIEVKSEKPMTSVSLLDLSGKEIYKGGNKKIPIKNLPFGIYIGQFVFKNGVSKSRKILVK